MVESKVYFEGKTKHSEGIILKSFLTFQRNQLTVMKKHRLSFKICPQQNLIVYKSSNIQQEALSDFRK